MKLPPIFANGAIFAAHKPICIFGEGTGAVTVAFAGNTLYTAARDGKFRVLLPEMDCGGPYTLTVTDGENSVCVSDIRVGEVYLMAGQSNMQFKLRESDFPKTDYFDDPLLRVFSTDRIEAGDVYGSKDGWVKITKENAGDFTAIGVMTALELRKRKNVPIGVITCYQGASVIESWMPKEVAELPRFTIPDSGKHGDHFYETYVHWNRNGDLYRSALRAQIAPYSVNGVVWYQGESDASDGEARIYRDELLAMIGVWRTDFLDPALPFYVIQLADFDFGNPTAWRGIQNAQLAAANGKQRIWCIACRDVCESDLIHPTHKSALSKRIADQICEL